MIPNRRLIGFSLGLHILGVIGLLSVAQLSAPVVSLNQPQVINVRFPAAPPAPPAPSSSSREPAVSRETPRPKRTARRVVHERPKPTPKPRHTRRVKPHPTPKHRATPKSTPKPEPTKPKPKPTERPPERTSPPPPPQPTRTYYPSPPPSERESRESSPRNAAPSAAHQQPKDASLAPGLSPSGSRQGALIGVRGGPSLNAYYSRQAIALIAANFKVPTDMQSEAVCVIGFYIMPDGRIVDPSIVQTSGKVDLDALALEALKKTERLPPLPDEFGSRSIEARLTFSFTTSTAAN